MAGRKRADPATLAAMRERKPVAAPDFTSPNDAPAHDGKPPRLPQPCPVTPLGASGKQIYFLDRLNQIQCATTRCEKGDMMLWFGDDWLCEHFMQEKRDKKGVAYSVSDEWDQRRAQIALVEDCALRGIFNPTGRVFGRGAHRFPGDPAQLALHMGNRVMLANAIDTEGQRRRDPIVKPAGRLVDPSGREAFFPALEALPAPATETASAAEGTDLLHFIRDSWFWKDKNGSALLLFGMVMQMYICGALDWRAHVWLAAPTASGKTSLQKVIRALHDDWCLHTEDASEAALRQVLGDDTLPVMIDEAEANDRPERLDAIMNLMKKSSSGAKMYRGSADHKAQGFTAQSCFLLSSVLHATMKGEDRNRIAILEMLEVPSDAAPLELELAHWRQLGKRMRRRMVDQWPRFDSTLEEYQAAIARAGFSGRWRDTYGTLLACADLALYDSSPRAVKGNGSTGLPRVDDMVRAITQAMVMGRSESRSDVDRCKVYLTSKLLPGAHGKPQESVGLWIERAMTWRMVQEFETVDPQQEIDHEARSKLRSHGLRVVNIEERPGGGLKYEDAAPGRWDDGWLAVAYGTNTALCEVFRGSEWADSRWLQSLGKVPGARKAGCKVRFGSSVNSDYALLVPLQAFRDAEE